MSTPAVMTGAQQGIPPAGREEELRVRVRAFAEQCGAAPTGEGHPPLEPLAFPAALSAGERRAVHEEAERCGLVSRSSGEGAARCVAVLPVRRSAAAAPAACPAAPDAEAEDAVVRWVRRTLALIEIEGAEEQARKAGAWVWSGEVAEAERCLGGRCRVRIEGSDAGGGGARMRSDPCAQPAGAPAGGGKRGKAARKGRQAASAASAASAPAAAPAPTAAALSPRFAFGVGAPVEITCGSGDDRGSARGIVTLAGDSFLEASVDADDWDHSWFAQRAQVAQLRSDVTQRLLRAALHGRGGCGFGHGGHPPLSEWRRLPEEQQRIVRLAFGSPEEREELLRDEGGRAAARAELDSAAPPAPGMKWFCDTLNPSQRRAVRAALGCAFAHLILGPPGTGKTSTLCEVVRQSVAQGLRVLVACPSNIAADNVVEKLTAPGGPAPQHQRVLRVGHSGRTMASVLQHSLDAKLETTDAAQLARDVRQECAEAQRKLGGARGAQRRQLSAELRSLNRELRDRERAGYDEVLSQATVVVGTFAGCASGPLRGRMFDLVVIDEAAMALEASCWAVLTRAPRCVLGGDPFQLPPTVLSQSAQELGETLFERLHAAHGSLLTTLLDTQYRMHRTICGWSSARFYRSLLRPAEEVADHLLCDLDAVEETPETSVPFALVDTATLGFDEVGLPGESKYNTGEAGVTVTYVQRLLAAGVLPRDVVVLTPYSAQAALIRDLLSGPSGGVEVGTVDSMQGREREAIVLSLVRSNADGAVGFLSDSRRINVAVTRARRHVAIVTDSSTVIRDPCLRSLCEHAEEEGVVFAADEYQ